MFIIFAILAAFSTIMPTSSWGLVTIMIPSTGRLWNTVSGTSPVPGGISTNMKSTSPQRTSVQNCFTVPAISAPRQITGSVSFSSSRFTLISFTPVRLSTGKIPSSVPIAFSRIPKIFGMDGPVISASSTAVLWPLRLVSTASRLVTRLLPTPPLPLTTAITFFTLLNAFCASSRLSGLLRDAQSAPQLEQSCVHSDMTFHLSLRSS